MKHKPQVAGDLVGLADITQPTDIPIYGTKTFQQYIPPATAEERRLGVSASTVCPQCAAPMTPSKTSKRDGGGKLETDPADPAGWQPTSDPADIVYLCSNGHEITGQALAALRGAALPAPAAIDRPPPVSRSGRHFPAPRRDRDYPASGPPELIGIIKDKP